MKPEVREYVEQCEAEGRNPNVVYLMRDLGLLREEAEQVIAELEAEGWHIERILTRPDILKRFDQENRAKRKGKDILSL